MSGCWSEAVALGPALQQCRQQNRSDRSGGVSSYCALRVPPARKHFRRWVLTTIRVVSKLPVPIIVSVNNMLSDIPIGTATASLSRGAGGSSAQHRAGRLGGFAARQGRDNPGLCPRPLRPSPPVVNLSRAGTLVPCSFFLLILGDF